MFFLVMFSIDDRKMCFGLVSESVVLIIVCVYCMVLFFILINSGDDGNIWGYII